LDTIEIKNEYIENEETDKIILDNLGTEFYNPNVMIEIFSDDGKSYHLVQDGKLKGGTKQRAIFPYLMRKIEYDEFVYAGPSLGFAQVALSYACLILKKKATIFVEGNDSHLSDLAAGEYGGKIFKVFNRRNPATLKQVQEMAFNYVRDKKDGKTFLLPFGFDDTEFKNFLIKSLKESLPQNFNPKRMWLVAGSATLLQVLSHVLTGTHFLVVQVGKKVWEDQLPEGRATLYIAPEKFYEKSIYPPPYKSVRTYDAKLWQFVKKFGEDGDYIWNVAKDRYCKLIENIPKNTKIIKYDHR